MELSDNLKKQNILLKASSNNRWDLIEEMVDLAVKNKEIDQEDCVEVKKALIEREKSMSTGIGNGVAIPHCTTSRVQNTVLIVSVVTRGMDFDSIDNQPVKIVILLLVPKNKLTQHIKTLANIAKLMSNENLRERMLNLKSAESIIGAIREFEKVKR
ncbi:MAG: PTS sugar transporter subunit IIA [Chrysiogenales bacterium]|nr:MAG: PTS sugar transporter subunit IIA [Chrysiogenales bacterium]